jgi:hypothetical protein
MTSNDLQDRIGQLEQLVTSLVNKPHETQLTSRVFVETEGSAPVEMSLGLEEESNHLRPESPSQFPQRAGRISFSRAETTYVESGHWTSILDRVCLKF